MKLIDMTMKDYLDVLKSKAPAPGGGSVSALAGAEAAALVSMVADLTIGKEKFAEYEQVCVETKKKMGELFIALSASIDLDTEAFNKVAAAYKMPKDTEELKEARSKAIREANIGATEVPFHVARLCVEGLKAMEKMAGKFNTNAASDFGVAALNFLAGAKGAWLNVKINLPGVKEQTRKEEFERAADFVREAEQLANQLYKDTEGDL